MCCSRLAANTGRKKVAKNRHLGPIAQLCRAISSQLRHISTIGKKLLSSHISSTCPQNMVNFGPLAAEIVALVWGTPANFNGFRVLAALLHGTLVVSLSQTAAFNRGRHLYSTGPPSRWALAHISSLIYNTNRNLFLWIEIFMAALCNRAGHYIFALWFLSSIFYLSSFFPRLISAAAGWMSTILWHTV